MKNKEISSEWRESARAKKEKKPTVTPPRISNNVQICNIEVIAMNK